RCASAAASTESNRQSSTSVAFSAKRAKLTPAPSQVAPSGYGCPGQTLIVASPRRNVFAYARSMICRRPALAKVTGGAAQRWPSWGGCATRNGPPRWGAKDMHSNGDRSGTSDEVVGRVVERGPIKAAMSDSLDPPGGIAVSFHTADSQPIEQVQIQIRHGLGLELDKAPGREAASTAARQDQGQVVVVVAVAVTVP